MQEEYNNIYNLAIDFRSKIKKLPLDLVSESPANAVTTLRIRNKCAGETIRILKDELGLLESRQERRERIPYSPYWIYEERRQ